jgi:iron complex transport system ATP-binding protein
LTATEEVGSAEAATELDVASLSVRFGALTALDGVSLAVRAGEVVALAEGNGAGKTTLIRAIAGDVVPAAGTIRLGGRPVTPACGGPASRARSRYRRGRSCPADGGLPALDVE